MSYNQTETTKEILLNEECIDLVVRLKNAILNGEISFIQALYNTSTPNLVDELESLIELSNRLREIPSLSFEDRKTREYLKNSLKSYENKQKKLNSSNGFTGKVWKL